MVSSLLNMERSRGVGDDLFLLVIRVVVVVVVATVDFIGCGTKSWEKEGPFVSI